MSNVNISVDGDLDCREVKVVLCTALAEYRAARSYGVAEAYVTRRYEYLKPGTPEYEETLARVQRNLDVSTIFLKALRGNHFTVTS